MSWRATSAALFTSSSEPKVCWVGRLLPKFSYPWPLATSSMRSTGWMRSSLHAGASTRTCSPAGAASKPIFARALAMPSASSSMPRRALVAATSSIHSLGSRSGVMPCCVPWSFTLLILPPLSAMEVATMLRAPEMALRSVPVTSKNTFLVSSVTVVSTPLIMGGNESTSPLLSTSRGYLSLPSRM